jgi:hypothetical protein
MDVKTKEIKSIFSDKSALNADEKGKTIIMDNIDNNGAPSANGVYYNRTFGALIMDESGKKLQDMKLPKGRFSVTATFASDFILSPDGSKAAYIEGEQQIGTNGKIGNDENNTCIKVIDTKTGDIKEIVKAFSLKDKNAKIDYITMPKIDKKLNVIGEIKRPIVPAISNICWDSTGTALSFTYGSSEMGNRQINTYIVSFDK